MSEEFTELHMHAPTRVTTVLTDVAYERVRQEDKWGVQHHPDGTDKEYRWIADAFREACDREHKAGEGTWLSILLEEVYEAASEIDYDRLRKELVQVAAVAAAWVEDIDWRLARIAGGERSFPLDGSAIQEIADPAIREIHTAPVVKAQIRAGLAYIRDRYGKGGQ